MSRTVSSSLRGVCALTLASMLFAACQCGPGVSCRDDSTCAPWGRCGASGYCVALPTTSDAGEDAGLPPPLMSLASDTLALGNVSCGQSATGSIMVSNGGEGPLELVLRSNASTFEVAERTTVPSRTTVGVMVTARMPSDVVAGQRLEGVITLEGNDPQLPRAFISVSALARGATLVASPPVSSFGIVPLTVDAGAEVTVRNTGNETAVVTLGAPGDGQFGFAESGFSVDAGASITLNARFVPSRAGAASTTVELTPMGAVCGDSADTLELRGQGTSGLVGLSSSDLFFGDNGRVACGATSPARTLTLINAGGSSFSWATALGKGMQSPFAVMPASGTLLANSQVTLNLTSTAIPSRASTDEGGFSDLLTLSTDSPGDQPHVVSLHQSAHGAVLRLTPSNVQFGGVPLTTSATAPVSLVNEGSASIGVSWNVAPSSFSLEMGAPTEAVVGTSTATVRFEPGTELMAQSGTLTLDVSLGDGGVLCADAPSAVTLSGSGTSGNVGFSPVALDFGLVNCGTTAPAQTVTFTNSGNQPYRVTAALANPSSPFSISLSPSDGTVAADGGTLQILVTPGAIPTPSAVTTNLYGDTLTVTTDVAGDAPHDIPLTQTARGSIFTFSTPSLQFGDVPVGSQGTAQFTVINSGNATGTLNFAPGSTGRFTVPASVTVAGGASTPVLGTFSPTMQMAVTDSAGVSATSSTVLCQPLPTPAGGPPRLGLEGRGTNTPVVVQSVNSLTFGASGMVPCGSQATAKTFTLRNDSTQALTLTPTVTGNMGAYVVNCPAMIGVGATVTVTVTPNAIPQTADTAADFFGATLTVRAQGGPVDENHVVALHMTAEGARLAFNTTALRNFDATNTQQFTVLNTGNTSASVTLSLSNTNNGFSRSPAGTTTVTTSGLVGSVTFTRPTLVLGVVNNSLSLATTSTLCAPLPAAMTLSSNP